MSQRAARSSRFQPRLAWFALGATVLGCSGSPTPGGDGPDGTSGSAGVPGTSGGGGTAPAAGGTSGMPGSGGSAGQVAGSGGAAGAGGSGGSGGALGTAGNGGGAGVGGSAGAAGAPATGGSSGAGAGGSGAAGAGGSSGAGMAGSGAAGAGGSSGAGMAGSGGQLTVGDLDIGDPVPGFASVAGGTTGGGTNLASAIVVTSMSQLESAAGSQNAAIILVEPGNYAGTLRPRSNKAIIGTRPGVTLTGNIDISGATTSNIIIRNIAVRGLRCNSYDECRAGADAVYIGNGAHHVWLDHLDVADGQDGNCDQTQGSDYITISWSHFHYTYQKEHRFSNLIAGSDDEPESVGKLRITYMNSHWGERVDSRQPRGRYGNVHMLNNLHDTGGGQIHGVGKDMALIAENSVYEEDISIFTDMGTPRGWKGVGNQGSGSDLGATRGTVFDIPYQYTPMPASQVKAAVTSTSCGAGNTCTLTR